MRILLTVILSLLMLVPTGAQQRKSVAKKPATSQRSTTKKTTVKTTGKTTGKTGTSRTTGKSRTSGKSVKTGKSAKSTKTTKKAPVYTNAEIKGLQNQRAAIKKKIQEQEQLLRANRADVKKRLDNLLVINSEIDERQKNIDNIQKDITHIEGNIGLLKAQLSS